MNDNPIRFDRIDRSKLSTMELDYRQRIFSDEDPSALASRIFLLVFLISTAVGISIALVGHWFKTDTGFVIATALGVVLAGLSLLRTKNRVRTALICLVVAPLLPLLFGGLYAALHSYLGLLGLLAFFVLLLV